jgi:hypothetical protein
MFTQIYMNFGSLYYFLEYFQKNRNKKGNGFHQYWVDSSPQAMVLGTGGPRCWPGQKAVADLGNWPSPRPTMGHRVGGLSVVRFTPRAPASWGTTVGQHFDGWGSTEGGSDDRAIEAYRSGLWWLATMRLWSYSWGRERGR